jgi:uncharacterized protein
MKIQPVQLSERIVSLDVLRGFAVLGILLINIQSFAMIEAAYLNPLAYGNFEGINKWVWIIGYLFGDMKFMAMFSMLFGAGVILFTERLEKKGIKPLRIHYWRTMWLFLFGLLHAYLLWYADILVIYSLCAVWIVLFRKKKPGTLLVAGLLFLSVASLLYILTGLSMPWWTDADKQALMQGWFPSAEWIQKEIATYRGGWIEQMGMRVDSALRMQIFVFFFLFVWRAGGLMLIGMAFFKWGILSLQKSKKFYLKMLTFCLIPGLFVVAWGIKNNLEAGFSMEYSFFLGFQYNYWGSLLVSFGYIALIMFLLKSHFLKALTKSLQAVGRMAFSNYILQTVICTTLFYGHGFGLFGKLERIELLLVVICIWVFQMVISPLWLKHFKYGPLEWLWRSLTYRHFQSFKT